jgi:acetylornithine/succinyldiaminopimelate/putrescine aminotransferase
MKGIKLPKLRTPVPGPNSLKLMKELREVECQNITYISEDYPVFISKSSLANVWDVDGNRYVDLISFFGVSLIGHNHPAIRKLLRNPQIINGMGDVLPSESKVKLLKKLSALLGGGYQGILGQNGADAVEAAIKTAYLYTGKKTVMAFEGGYHGLSFGALLCTFNPKFKDPFRSLIPDISVYFPFPQADNWLEVINNIEKYLKEKGDVSLLIMEPVQARGGVRIAPVDFIKALREITLRYGVVLAFDEIFSGLGRCGKKFVYEYYGVKPDIILLGKALSSSFPISVMMAREEIMKAWPSSGGEALHTSTHLGHPLISEIAYNLLCLMEKEKVWDQVSWKGSIFLSKLSKVKADFPEIVREVRGMGLLLGIEFHHGIAFDVSKKLLKLGYITLPSGLKGEVLELAPSFVITEKIMDDFVSKLNSVLKEWTYSRG